MQPGTTDPICEYRGRIEEQSEEPGTLQVVEMEMAEQDMQLRALGSLHRDTEWPYSGAGVEHEEVAACKSHFNAGRISAVLDCFWTRRSDRAAASQETELASSLTRVVGNLPEHRHNSVHFSFRSEQRIRVACTSRCMPSKPVAATVL